MIKIVIATLALGIVAAPALAAAEPDSAPVAATPAAAPTPTAAAKTRYCVVDTRTGSRIPTRTCKTRTQWLEQGFDPIAK